jgi:hypothetical protein
MDEAQSVDVLEKSIGQTFVEAEDSKWSKKCTLFVMEFVSRILI